LHSAISTPSISTLKFGLSTSQLSPKPHIQKAEVVTLSSLMTINYTHMVAGTLRLNTTTLLSSI
jgi:hypothetical protein